MGDRRREPTYLRPSGPLTRAEPVRRRVARRRRRRRIATVVLLAVIAAAAVIVAARPGSLTGHHPLASVVPVPRGPRAPVKPARATARRAPRSAPRPAHPHSGPPTAGVDALLRRSGYVRLAGARTREVALTFDDGPGPYTPRILRTLERLHTPATFFAIGHSVSLYPGDVAREARDGFAVGDHTESHAFLSRFGAAFQKTQLQMAAQAVHRAGAPYPRLFRPPYGAFNRTTLGLLKAMRLAMVLWSVDTSDYARPGVERIVFTALSGARPGAVILMHDGGGDRSETAAALPRIIAALRRRGYHLVTVPQLLVDDPPPAHQPAPQPLAGVS
jgi:peptidoglycan/xylan/chitin deacetylase (PgdA/CDA1 family)